MGDPTSTVSSLNLIAGNIKQLIAILQVTYQVHWWNTQWFSAVIAVIATLAVSSANNYHNNRKRRLYEFYGWFMKQQVFINTESLLQMGRMTTYGGTLTKDGITTQIPEKPIGEKMVIELRSKFKYWQLPIGSIRSLFKKYEKLIYKIPNSNLSEIKATKEYLEAEETFSKIYDTAKRKTGENEWTA